MAQSEVGRRASLEMDSEVDVWEEIGWVGVMQWWGAAPNPRFRPRRQDGKGVIITSSAPSMRDAPFHKTPSQSNSIVSTSPRTSSLLKLPPPWMETERQAEAEGGMCLPCVKQR